MREGDHLEDPHIHGDNIKMDLNIIILYFSRVWEVYDFYIAFNLVLCSKEFCLLFIYMYNL